MTRSLCVAALAACVVMTGCRNQGSARYDGYRGARYDRARVYDGDMYEEGRFGGRYDHYDRRLTGADWGDDWYDDSKPEPYGWDRGYRTTRRGF